MPIELELRDAIQDADAELTNRYRAKLIVNPNLDRKRVSFGANKGEVGSRWFHYKEGFSVSLMRYLLETAGLKEGHLLDPFAGSGTALFAAAAQGMSATGIELLPSSAESIQVRSLLNGSDPKAMIRHLRAFRQSLCWERTGETQAFGHLAITRGAFPAEMERQLGRYLYEAKHCADPDFGRVLRFAALCILEEISYTRKDGQYLRWDYRAHRRQGAKPFDKGRISSFTEAIMAKFSQMEEDLCAVFFPRHLFDTELLPESSKTGNVRS